MDVSEANRRLRVRQGNRPRPPMRFEDLLLAILVDIRDTLHDIRGMVYEALVEEEPAPEVEEPEEPEAVEAEDGAGGT